MKKYQFFLSENFQFLVVKFSIYIVFEKAYFEMSTGSKVDIPFLGQV